MVANTPEPTQPQLPVSATRPLRFLPAICCKQTSAAGVASYTTQVVFSHKSWHFCIEAVSPAKTLDAHCNSQLATALAPQAVGLGGT